MQKKELLKKVWRAVDGWFQPDNMKLKRAIERTVDENLFRFPDIKHAILALKENISEDILAAWQERYWRNNVSDADPKKVLCLHAGNLPLVGFQDVLAVLLSGNQYLGKISKKDPWLMESFLKFAAEKEGLDSLSWSRSLQDHQNAGVDGVMFSGSAQTVPVIKEKLAQLEITKAGTHFVIRDAHFSMAFIRDDDPKTMRDLTEGVFRYGGQGCRSVAVVVAPFELDEIKCHFTDYIESFWLQNPQHTSPDPVLRYQWAYNKAIERPHAWLDHFMIQQGGIDTSRSFTLFWVPGDQQKAKEIAEKHRHGLQNIFVPDRETVIEGFEDRMDLLSNAQRPPIDWKPDGVDPLQWLVNLRAEG